MKIRQTKDTINRSGKWGWIKYPLLSLLLASNPMMMPVSAQETAAKPDLPPYTSFSAKDEALHNERFQALVRSFASGVGLNSYSPMVAVPGKADAGIPRRPASENTISADALNAVTDYAASKNSDALMVYRRGALEHEAYFGDTTKDTLINARSMAKPITAIAIARAIKLGFIPSLDEPIASFITEWQDPLHK